MPSAYTRLLNNRPQILGDRVDAASVAAMFEQRSSDGHRVPGVRGVAVLERFLRDRGLLVERLAAPTTLDVLLGRFRAWMVDERNLAEGTVRTITLRISAVKTFLAYAAVEDVTLVALSQAAHTLKPSAAPRRPIEYLSEGETRAVLAAFTGRTAKSRRNRMLLILLYDTAARVGELTGLNRADWAGWGAARRNGSAGSDRSRPHVAAARRALCVGPRPGGTIGSHRARPGSR